MLAFQLYLNSPQTKKVLSKKPGEEGFSLIELVVVVAVLAIIAAIAIPSFTSLNAEARVAGAKTVLANLVKECAVKILDSNPNNQDYIAANYQPNGYQAVTSSLIDETVTTGDCNDANIYTLTPLPNTNGTFDLPSFSLNAQPGEGVPAKTCEEGDNATSSNRALGCTVFQLSAEAIAGGAVQGTTGTW